MEKRRTYSRNAEIDRLYDIADELDEISLDFDNHASIVSEEAFNRIIGQLRELVRNSNEYELKRIFEDLSYTLDTNLLNVKLEERYKYCHDTVREMAACVRRQKDYVRNIRNYGNFSYHGTMLYYKGIKLELPDQQKGILSLMIEADNNTIKADEIKDRLSINENNVSEAVRKLKTLLQKQCGLNPNESIVGSGKSPRTYKLDVHL